jgi:hypothetical protein
MRPKKGVLFLKKRTKKLWPVAINISAAGLAPSPDAMDKSFWLLFFKKDESFLTPKSIA